MSVPLLRYIRQLPTTTANIHLHLPSPPRSLNSSRSSSATYNLINYNYAVYLAYLLLLLLLVVPGPSLSLSSLIDVSRSVGLLCGSCRHPCLCRICQAHSYFNVLRQLPQEGVHHPASTYYHFHLLPLHLGVRFLWVLTLCIDPWLPKFHNRPTVVSACILFCNEFATQHQEWAH